MKKIEKQAFAVTCYSKSLQTVIGTYTSAGYTNNNDCRKAFYSSYKPLIGRDAEETYIDYEHVIYASEDLVYKVSFGVRV